MDSGKRSLLRWSISDLLLMAVCVALAVVGKLWFDGHYGRPSYESRPPIHLLPLFLYVATIVCGIVLALIAANLLALRPIVRVIVIFVVVSVLWLPAARLMQASRMPWHPPAALALVKTIAEAQEIYRRSNQGYADTVDKLANAGLLNTAVAAAAVPDGPPVAGNRVRLLFAQGNRSGGAKSFIAPDGKITGYAIVVYPMYNKTGRYTFMLCSNGECCWADLGPNTALIVNQMDKFDPGPEWEMEGPD